MLQSGDLSRVAPAFSPACHLTIRSAVRRTDERPRVLHGDDLCVPHDLFRRSEEQGLVASLAQSVDQRLIEACFQQDGANG